MITIQVSATNSKDGKYISGFVSMPKFENIQQRYTHLKSTIENGSFRNWVGKERVRFIENQIAKGNTIQIAIVAGEPVTLVAV